MPNMTDIPGWLYRNATHHHGPLQVHERPLPAGGRKHLRDGKIKAAGDEKRPEHRLKTPKS